MKYLYSVLMGLCLSYAVIAQSHQPPNYHEIEKATLDEKSPFYFPSLLDRYRAYDSTLTITDCSYLYYGYLYQPTFQLNWVSPNQEKIQKYYQSQSISPSDYDEVIALTRESIKDYPFALREMSLLIYVLQQQKEEKKASQIVRQYSSIIDVIFASGDGKSCKTGYHVVSISHEYTLMHVMKLGVIEQSLQTPCDYLKAEENDQKISGVYFDVTKILEKESEAIGGKSKKKRR